MQLKKHHYLLILIFVAVLSFRLYFAFQTPYFSDDSSYFVLRQVEHISKTGLPLYNDSLSYSGRTLFFSPFFHYVLAFFNLFLPLALVGKIIPNIFASSIVFAVYLVAAEITKQKKAALVAAFTAGFIPIFIKETMNSVSNFSLITPLLFFIIYALLKLNTEKKFALYLVILISVFIFVDTISFVLILGLIFYFLLTRTEDIHQNKAELEVVLFSCFLFFWLNFVIFKKAFLLYGPAVIWQNIPNVLLSNYFSQITILEAIYAIGIIPFIFGIFIIYDFIFKHKKKSIYLLISLALAAFLLAWFKLIPMVSGLMFFGPILVLLFAQYVKNFIIFISKTKFHPHQNKFLSVFIILIILTSVLPSFIYANNAIKRAPNKEEINAYLWIKESTPKDSVILASIQEGHFISYFGERKNAIDSNFLLIPNIDQRVKDIERIYTTPYKVEAVRLLNKYNVNYVVLSNYVYTNYKIEELKYTTEDCFRLVYNETIKIYQSLCKVEESK